LFNEMKSAATRSTGFPGIHPARFPLLAFARFALCLALGGAPLKQAAAHQAEHLDRGVVAIQMNNGHVYVGWRLLLADPAEVAFDILRSAEPGGEFRKLNDAPLADSCNFIDVEAEGKTWHYKVRALSRGKVVAESEPARSVSTGGGETSGGYVSIKLQGNYTFSKVGIADLDGDGVYDYVIKQPGGNVDPGRPRPSPDTYKIEAYNGRTGEFMWRHDLGWNINMGIWFSPMVVYDFDGDGKAEVALKTAPFAATPEESFVSKEGMAQGFVVSGPEYCSILDGTTGKEVARVDWIARGNPVSWGDPRGNRVNRNLIGLAYLDGKRPSLLALRGTYTLMRVDAYHFEQNELRPVWKWSGDDESPPVRGQGMHGLYAVDLDGDGRDEIVLGSAVLDDNGTLLWSTGKGHPDAVYVADIDPERPGYEIIYGYESPQAKNGICLVDGRTGEIIWGHPHPTKHIHDQGMLADIDPANPGFEFYGAEQDGSGHWLYDARTGKLLSTESLNTLSPRAFWWLDGPTKVYSPFNYRARSNPVLQFNGPRVADIPGSIIAIADVLGDWREELIVSVPGELRIYTTTVPAATRRLCLMQDRLYRTSVAMQAMGYLFPPQTGGKYFDAPVAK
jgi:rhamnogalacturonan endolyase